LSSRSTANNTSRRQRRVRLGLTAEVPVVGALLLDRPTRLLGTIYKLATRLEQLYFVRFEVKLR
jgi:hypothetical protein